VQPLKSSHALLPETLASLYGQLTHHRSHSQHLAPTFSFQSIYCSDSFKK